MKLTRSLKAAGLACAVLALTQPARAEDYRIRLSAFVPTSCSAELVGTPQAGPNGVFSLGRVNESCNTRFQLTLLHGLAPQGARVGYKGVLQDAGPTSTVLDPLSAPSRGSNAEVTLHNVDQDAADTFGSALTIAVTPVGF